MSSVPVSTTKIFLAAFLHHNSFVLLFMFSGDTNSTVIVDTNPPLGLMCVHAKNDLACIDM